MLCCHYIVLCTVVLGLKTISDQPYRIDMNKISYWNHVQSECGLMPLQYVGICFVSLNAYFAQRKAGRGKRACAFLTSHSRCPLKTFFTPPAPPPPLPKRNAQELLSTSNNNNNDSNRESRKWLFACALKVI